MEGRGWFWRLSWMVVVLATVLVDSWIDMGTSD